MILFHAWKRSMSTSDGLSSPTARVASQCGPCASGLEEARAAQVFFLIRREFLDMLDFLDTVERGRWLSSS